MTDTLLISHPEQPEFVVEVNTLKEHDIEITTTFTETPNDLIDIATDASIIIVSSRTPITASVFENLPQLQAVGRLGIGVDNIDIDAAAAANVHVLHTPAYCVDEVSTHAMALILSTYRHLLQYDSAIRDGTWDWRVGEPTHRFANQTVGIVGVGKIGQAVAEKLSGFGVELLGYDPYLTDDSVPQSVTLVSFDQLLDQSDIITIHAPLTTETRHLFDRDSFSRMKDSSILVNTARGPIIDQQALYTALISDEIAAAGLDVLEQEPPNDTPLTTLDNVIFTPHAAWYSEAAITDRKQTMTQDVIRVLNGDAPQNAVDPDSEW